ncbi:MAG: SDR family oxidoreductase [Chloroflexota bacterium]
MSEFVGKTAVITGGNGGIGKAIALAFARAGAFVVILGRNAKKGAVALAELQAIGAAAFHTVDLSRAEEIETSLANYPQIDILVNNAGAGESRGGTVKIVVVGQGREEINGRFADLMGSNLQSAYLMSALSAPLMPNGASIVNISSTASIHGNYGLYGTFKAGLDGLTRSLAVELAPRNVRVNAIAPGWIQTANTLPDAADPGQAQWAVNTSLLGRMGRPEEIADAVLFLASARASFITGTVLTVDGGLSVIDPTAESWRDVRS